MCGIFGFAGPSSYRAASLLQALAIADESRGKHSTGVAITTRIEGKLQPIVAKKALSGSEFVRAGYTSVLFQHKYNLAIGHNRYATAGAVNDRNAHPFAVPTPHGVALACHNGMVGGKEVLAEHFGVKDYPVDSEVLFRAIARHSGRSETDFLDAIERVVQFIRPRADFACLWMEPARRSIYFFRSDERPLAVIDARKLGLGRFFCSTIEIFANAWGTVRGCLPSIKKVSYFEVRPLTVYRVTDDGRWEVERIREIKVKTPAAPAPGSALRQETLDWKRPSSPSVDDDDDDDEGRRVFICVACRTPVDTEDAVFRNRRPFHDDCLADLEADVSVPPTVA